jgi:hypothetical protein
VFPVSAAPGSGGGGDGGVQLADKLKIFKTDNFDPDAYVQSKCRTMDEKVRNFIPPEIRLERWLRKGRVLLARKREGYAFRGGVRIGRDYGWIIEFFFAIMRMIRSGVRYMRISNKITTALWKLNLSGSVCTLDVRYKLALGLDICGAWRKQSTNLFEQSA